MPKDFLDHDFEVGDRVVWAVLSYRSVGMRTGTVREIDPNTKTIKMDIEEKKYDRWEEKHIPTIRKGTLSTPKHAIILNKV